jgi:hypothetical protein
MNRYFFFFVLFGTLLDAHLMATSLERILTGTSDYKSRVKRHTFNLILKGLEGSKYLSHKPFPIISLIFGFIVE